MSKRYPGLYKRGKTWWIKFTGDDGKPVYQSTGKSNEREAIAEAKEIESKFRNNLKDEGLPTAFQAILFRAAHEANAGKLTLARTEDLLRELHRLANPQYERVSLDQHLANWIADQVPHVSPRTISIYGDMRRRMTNAIGKRKSGASVDSLSTDDVKLALAKIKKGRTAATTNQTLRAFRRAMEAAVQAGLCSANPAGQVRPYKETDSKVVAPFSKEEFAALLSHVRSYYTNHNEWEGAILIGGHTGLRFGDVLNLSRKNVHGNRIVVETGKTGRVVEIPITPPVARWIGERSGRFFPILGAKGPGSLSTTFTRIMERAGVARDIDLPGRERKGRRSFHSLRHSFASWLADSDVHADVRKRLTGHSADGIHERYTHHDEAPTKQWRCCPENEKSFKVFREGQSSRKEGVRRGLPENGRAFPD